MDQNGSWTKQAWKWPVILLIALGVSAIVVAFVSLDKSGIGWDSRYETEAALSTRSVPPDSSLEQAYELVPTNSEFQGTFLYQASDILHTIRSGATAAGSGANLLPDDPETYRYQGLVNLILALLAVTALAIALAVTLKSLLVGAFFWSLTLSTPLWLGMSHVDFKDVPVAAGLTLVSSGLILSLALENRAKATFFGVILSGLGGAVALSSRAATLILILALAGGTVFLAFVLCRGHRPVRTLLPAVLSAAAALVVALVFTSATNPIARIDLFAWLWDAFQENRSFPFEGTILTAGVNVDSSAVPFWYVPTWLMAQLPLLTLISLGAAAGLLIARFWRDKSIVRSPGFVALLPVLLQGFVLPTLIVIGGAVLYDGIRHLIFMIPGILAIPAVGLALVERNPPSWLRSPALMNLAVVLVVVFSFFASVRWAPYSYAFINPVAGIPKDAWELDYWGVTAREGLERLREAGLERNRVRPASDVGIPFGAEATNGPIESPEPTGLYEFIRGSERASDLGCEVLFQIKRDGQLLGEGARCPAYP